MLNKDIYLRGALQNRLKLLKSVPGVTPPTHAHQPLIILTKTQAIIILLLLFRSLLQKKTNIVIIFVLFREMLKLNRRGLLYIF